MLIPIDRTELIWQVEQESCGSSNLFYKTLDCNRQCVLMGEIVNNKPLALFGSKHKNVFILTHFSSSVWSRRPLKSNLGMLN